MHFQWGRKHFLVIGDGDAAYRKHAGGEPSHGRRQHAQKLVKIARACVVPGIMFSRTDTDRPIDAYSTQ